MGQSHAVPIANKQQIRSTIDELGYSKKPLKLNLNRQYMIKEYLQTHGGYGHGPKPRQVAIALGVAFGLTALVTFAQKRMFTHEVPSTLNKQHKAAEDRHLGVISQSAIADHVKGNKVPAHVFDFETEKQKIEDNGESD
eukprot:CAMPEP_0168591444 /NCGR_PEP_ID=MMETSP0420-20121227/7140_1 /TAXON_ID=498008 /ORGANISM="Pessonella sp." /LENGTH=138 /DNA_ID=CAMNT_0008627241 /DNA_START=54 /DNA_END=470 /DNA_ORIENTATION=+